MVICADAGAGGLDAAEVVSCCRAETLSEVARPSDAGKKIIGVLIAMRTVDFLDMYCGSLSIRTFGFVAMAAALGLLAAAGAIALDVSVAGAVMVAGIVVLGALLLKANGRSKRLETNLRDAVARYEKAQAKLRYVEKAIYEDPETRLGNRRQLERDAGKALARQKRWGEPCAIAIVRLGRSLQSQRPLDHQTLSYLAEVLREVPRVEDGVYRLGERVFAVLLTSCTRDGAEGFRERLRSRFSGSPLPGELGGGLAKATVGIAASGDTEWTLDGLLAEAKKDHAAYLRVVDRNLTTEWGTSEGLKPGA